MGTKVNFGGSLVTLPNSYARIVSGAEYPEVQNLSGECLLIDMGGNANWGMGSGIDGENNQGLESFYRFTTPQQAKNVISGGRYFKDVDFIFKPALEFNGTPALTVVKCATTTSSLITVPFGAVNFKAKTKFEGAWANGGASGETLASWEFSVSTVGNFSDTHGMTIGSVNWVYTVVGGEPLNKVALELAKLVNADTVNGFTAISIGEKIIVTAPIGSGDTLNSEVAVYDTTGFAFGGVSLKKEGSDNIYLNKGFAVTVDLTNSGKYKMRFFKSTYAGQDDINNVDFDLSVEKSAPKLLAESKEFSKIQELITWANKNDAFKQYFVLVDETSGTDDIVSNFGQGYILATGGTESYDVNLLDTILDNINKTDVEFIFTTENFANSLSAVNLKLNTWIREKSRYTRQHLITGGTYSDDFESTKDVCREYDNDLTQVVYSGFELDGLIYDAQSSLYKYAGRMGGIEAENPPTRKSIGVDKLTANLTDDQLTEAIDNGVLTFEYNTDAKDIIVLQSINTLQDNDRLDNADGTTFSVQLKRLDAFVNKTLMVNSNLKLLLNDEGANKRNLTPAILKKFGESELALLIDDGKILAYRNVVASIDQDNAFLTYEFEANTEITKLFITGTRKIF